MNRSHWLASDRISGALLVASLGVLVMALVVLVGGGAFSAFSASLQGSIEELATHRTLFRFLNLLYAVGWVVQLCGFAVLSRVLVRSGDDPLAVLGLVVTAVAAVLAIVEATFRMGVTPWAAAEAAVGELPDLYTALLGWVGSMKILYLALGLFGQMLYGGALLRTRLLPRWVGQTALAWGGGWLLLLITARSGAPAVLFISPAVVGMALLAGARDRGQATSTR